MISGRMSTTTLPPLTSTHTNALGALWHFRCGIRFFFFFQLFWSSIFNLKKLHLLHLCLPRGCNIYIFIRLARLSTASATVVVLALLRFLQADTAASDTRVSEPLNFKKKKTNGPRRRIITTTKLLRNSCCRCRK